MITMGLIREYGRLLWVWLENTKWLLGVWSYNMEWLLWVESDDM